MKSLLTFFILCFALPQATAAKPFVPVQWQTSHGARVVYYQAMEVPMLDISVAFAAGSAYDGEHFGLSALTTRLLNQGNSGLDGNAMADKLAETGAQYQSDSNRDMAIFSLKTLTSPQTLKNATDTFASIINHPDFPMDTFQREKNQQLMAISQALGEPDEVANQTFSKALYKKHPYAHAVNGSNETVNALSLNDVHNFYKQFFVSRNAVIVLVGAIDESTAHTLAETITANLPEGETASPIPKAEPLTEEMNVEVQFPSSQTVLRMGQLGIDHQDPNFFPLQVGNYTLGGGMLVSRLAQEVREKRGLSYGVYSQFAPMPGLGPFLISLSTKNSQAKTAINVTRETLSSFIKTGPDEHELQAAKQYLTGSFPLSLASNRSIADMLLKIAFYHLPADYLDTYIDRINAVTSEQIKHAFEQLVFPDKLLQVTVGKV